MKKSLILLSGLVAANVAPIQSSATPDRPAFSVRAECFETSTGDGVTTESTDKGMGVRWDIRYPDRQCRWLAKSISERLLQDTTGASVWVRGRTRHQLGIRMVDDEGECHSLIFNVEPRWNQMRFDYAELTHESDEPLDPAKVEKLVVFDYSAMLQPQKRGRTVWLADWRFTRA